MAVLVTGGAGYIGSHTVYELIGQGYDVAVADDLSTGHIEAVHEKARFYNGDIRDKAFLSELFRKETIDGVIHFAASSLVGESMVDPLKYYNNNMYGTMVLLEAMVENGIDKIVFSSSAAVYGEPEAVPIREEDVTAPLNTYGETKLAMERMMKWTSEAHGLRYAALRYFNACGAHVSGGIGEDHFPETHLIPIVIQAASGRREYISVFGNDYDTPDGTCIRDYVHVTDLAGAHVLAFEYLAGGGASDVFNLGSGRGFSVAEIIEHTKRVTGRDFAVKYEDRRPGDPAVLIASGDKAERVLGWRPESSEIGRVLETAWEWHRNHPDGFGKRDDI